MISSVTLYEKLWRQIRIENNKSSAEMASSQSDVTQIPSPVWLLQLNRAFPRGVCVREEMRLQRYPNHGRAPSQRLAPGPGRADPSGHGREKLEVCHAAPSGRDKQHWTGITLSWRAHRGHEVEAELCIHWKPSALVPILLFSPSRYMGRS